MPIHSVRRSQNHLAWNKSYNSYSLIIRPVVYAQSGDTIALDCLDCVPVHIEDALPGDTLWVDVLEIETGIKLPLRPFPGEMGVAAGKEGAFWTSPPYNTGGNLDTKYLHAGSTLYLPIEAEGALFLIGVRHTPIHVKARLAICKDKPYTKTPHYTTTEAVSREDYYCTTGIDSDIKTATRAAVRYMIDYLFAEHQLGGTEAYMLCGIAEDLKLHEEVRRNVYLLHALTLTQRCLG
ncbi:hypothetical protein BDN71DRAFT_1488320 [Pleurotus eryngii]|uniref:Acetamidase n=1 Tax=Pleurotus eryngii TaxID=5323 RepID=A0A9P6A0L0_PLEER|nr:hypothetical protein BDN71DRAFT_1488320 [Pleurotus eryngii]